MKTKNNFKKSFNENDMKAFEPENKIGLLATVNQNGLPHITLITTLKAKTPNQMFWGQFSEGQSKKNLQNNPKAAFLIMNQERQLWRGKVNWTHLAKEGKDYESFNNLPMWRYNAYFGIHTIHYMDLVETTEQQSLPLASIVRSSLLTKFAKSAAAQKGSNETRMNNWTQDLFNRLDAIKFLSYVSEDGHPVIIPLLQCQTGDTTRLVFHPGAYKKELAAINPGQDVAVFGLTLSMEDVLTRGKFLGYKRYRGLSLGAIDINWVYNSMPPMPGQIYPSMPIQEVVNF